MKIMIKCGRDENVLNVFRKKNDLYNNFVSKNSICLMRLSMLTQVCLITNVANL